MNNNKSYSRSVPVLANRKCGVSAPCNRGFTLVEVIVVMAILGVLALMALPAYGAIKDKVRNVRAVEEIRGIEKTITAFSIDRGGTFPTSFTDLGIAPIDPWGNAYEYHLVTESGYTARSDVGRLNDDYDLFSHGADGRTDPVVTNTDGMDDILRTGDGGYVGVASQTP